MTARRPRLDPQLPVLVRDPETVQVGLDARGVLLPSSDPQRLCQLLGALDGSRTITQLCHELAVSERSVQLVLGELATRGLLVSGPPAPDASRSRTVRLIGSGRLARAFAEAYLMSGLGELRLVDPGLADPELYRDLRPDGAQTLKAHLRAKGFTGLSTADHWYADSAPADFTVVAADTLECDRGLTDTLLREDQPHLFLRPLVDGVVLGPLVVPGQTACTRCTDLLRGQDVGWPTVLAQLCHTTAEVAEQLAHWIAHTAVLQLRGWFAAGRPETLGCTLEVHHGEWTISQRSWPRHPDCGCAGV